MAIDRRTRFRAGALSPEIIEPNTGLAIDPDTGTLNAQYLVDERTRLDTRIDNLYWKDPVNSKEFLGDPDFKLPEDYRLGETFYSEADSQIYVFIPDYTVYPQGVIDFWQPQTWIDASRLEAFLPVPVGLDKDTLATKAFVISEISNLVGGAPDVLDTIYELAEAINNNENFATDILQAISNLDNNKANKSDVYTKLEVDALDDVLNTRISSLAATQRRVVEYIVGADYSDSTDLSALVNQEATNSQEFKTFLIRPDATTSDPTLLISSANKFFTGLDPNNAFLIPSIRIAPQDSTSKEDFIVFSNLHLDQVSIPADPNTTQATVLFKNCIFDDSSILFNESNIDVIVDSCTFNFDVAGGINIGQDVSCLITNSTVFFNGAAATIYGALGSDILFQNSKLHGYVNLLQEAKFVAVDSTFEINSNVPFFNLTSLDYENGDYSSLYLENTIFKTPQGYSSNYVEGEGRFLANLNVIDDTLDASNNTIIPKVSALLNGGRGATAEDFIKPLGYEHFFYNDERAQDVISEMITGHTLNDPAFLWNYDDANATLSLTLDISSSKLSDSQDIAYVNRPNTFTHLNVFSQIEATSATFTSATAPTQDQSDNSTKLATTEYVRTAFSNLEADIENLLLEELGDVSVASPSASHVIAYNPSAILLEDRWINRQLSSFDLSDSSDVIRAGDHVFRLDRIARPSRIRQTGSGAFTGGYSATNQVLSWNGLEYDSITSTTPGPGAWKVSLSNDLLLKSTEEPAPGVNTEYDGWGKIALATYSDVRQGNSSNLAVVPSKLYANYARRDASNLTELEKQDFRQNIDFPAQGNDYLRWNSLFNAWENEDRTLSKYNYLYIDPLVIGDTVYTASKSDFLNVKTYKSQITTIKLGDFPEGNFVKIRKDTDPDNGVLSISLVNQNEYILTHDNVKRYATTDGTNTYNPQIDLTIEGHTVLCVRAIDSLGQSFWHVFGYYYNSANQDMPTPELVIQPESIQDAVSALFDHPGQDDAISIYYNDPLARIESRLVFATQQQVAAGTVSNLPVAPDTLSNYVASAISAATLQTSQDIQTALTTTLLKDNNLSDLTNVAQARLNLALTQAATTDLGFTSGLIPFVANGASLVQNQALIFDGNGIVSTTMSLGGGGTSDPATTADFGLVRLADQEDQDNDDVLTVGWLNTALSTEGSSVATAIQALSGSSVYQAQNTQFNASIGTYYSLSTANGSFNIYLPSINGVVPGPSIKFKLRQNSSGKTISIIPAQNEKIDLSTDPILLDEEGQFITLTVGFDGNWEIN